MSLHSTCLPVAHEDEDLCLFTYSINSCIRPLALSCKRLCFISGMNVINDLCICVLHLKLWMLALIQGLALQSQGSFSFTKEGSYTIPMPQLSNSIVFSQEEGLPQGIHSTAMAVFSSCMLKKLMKRQTSCW